MDCACEMGGYSYDNGPELFTSKIVKARKKYACEECRSSIHPGEKHEYVVGKWDGDFASFRTCRDCLSLRDQFFTKGHTIGSLWLEFSDTLYDWGYEVPEDCIVELSDKAREKVCRAIEEGWGYLENRKSTK